MQWVVAFLMVFFRKNQISIHPYFLHFNFTVLTQKFRIVVEDKRKMRKPERGFLYAK